MAGSMCIFVTGRLEQILYSKNKIEEGTIIEISVQKPGQEKLTSNIKVLQSDLDLLQSLKELGM